MFYGQAGGKDLLKRKWKNLAELVTLECDGKDITSKLKEAKVHAIVFLNIASYGGGTHPWNKSGGQFEPSTDDGLIEVVGLTTYQLVTLTLFKLIQWNLIEMSICIATFTSWWSWYLHCSM